MRIRILPIVLLAFSGWVQAAAPKVEKTVPENGATEVDPAIKEIRVTFDQAMQQGGYSWVGGGPSFPKTTGKAYEWRTAREAGAA